MRFSQSGYRGFQDSFWQLCEGSHKENQRVVGGCSCWNLGPEGTRLALGDNGSIKKCVCMYLYIYIYYRFFVGSQGVAQVTGPLLRTWSPKIQPKVMERTGVLSIILGCLLPTVRVARHGTLKWEVRPAWIQLPPMEAETPGGRVAAKPTSL